MNPWINIIGDVPTIVEASKTNEYVDNGATCQDQSDGNLNHAVEVSGSVVNLKHIGEYEIKYNCKDMSDNAAVEKKRTVVVKDTLAPVITLHGESFSCDDSFDYNTTSSLQCSHGDCGQCTYTCTDSSQNSANATADIHCPYDPCEGKQENCLCHMCPIDDPNCAETMVVKSCQLQQNSLQCHAASGDVQDCSTPPAQICCKAMTADCLACSFGLTVEEYCRRRPETQGCPSPECPQGCSSYFDGCNRCVCSNGVQRCTARYCNNCLLYTSPSPRD